MTTADSTANVTTANVSTANLNTVDVLGYGSGYGLVLGLGMG